MNWRHSITVRLSLAFALLTTLVFTALGIYLGRSADHHMAELDAHELMGKLVLVRHISQQAGTPEALAARLSDALVGEHGITLTVDGESGPLFNWPQGSALNELAKAAVRVGESPVRLNVAGKDFRIVASEMQTGWGEPVRVLVARDIRHHTDFLDQFQRDFWLALLAASLLTVILGIVITRHGMHPIRHIAQTAGRISAGQLGERMSEDKVPPELAEMTGAFNAMLGRLEESFARLSDFSADLAHELRTPIHALRMQTEVSLSKSRSNDEYRELLLSNLEEYERLSTIIADMLFLAKADHGLLIPHRESVELMPLCERLVEYYGLLAEHIDLKLLGSKLRVQGDRLMLERAIGNLLVNAIHHTPENGSIRVQVSAQDKRAIITLTNSGPPIPPEAIERIFDRFVRLDHESEGSGLGLAITRSIIQAHGGDISVRGLLQATEFSIALPCQESAENRG